MVRPKHKSFFFFAILAVLMAGCAPAMEPVINTPEPSASAASPTSTPTSPPVASTPADAQDELGTVLVSWSKAHEGGCDSALISAFKVAYGPCDGGLSRVDIASNRGEGARYLAGKFMPFDAESAAGTVSFVGTGPVTATPAQQRAIIEWAQLVYQEASAGRSGAAWGLVFGWRRDGGIAGFCDDVAVYLSGEAIVTSCQQPQMGHFWLNANQLRMVFTWVDELRSFEDEETDPAITDAMTRYIAFSGIGTKPAGDDEILNMHFLAEELAARHTLTADEQAMDSARQALEDYFRLLADADYAGVAAAYGGSYEVLIGNNPDISPEDHAALFEAGCTYNGFVCNLSLLNLVEVVGLSEVDYRVTVELLNPDGSLFILGPCCGATEEEMPPTTQFDFRVSLVEGRYRVMDLPVYVP